MRYMLTDDLWAVMGPLVAPAKGRRGGQPPGTPDRLFFEAVLYWARTGVPWRDLPGAFGAWDAVYNRLGRWVRSGALRRLFEALTAAPELGDVRRVLIDSTIVRAHQHAAGARRRQKSSARPGRPPGRRSAARQALGRSRGGLSTKVILTAADEDTAIAVDVVPGQAADAPLLEPMLDATIARVPHFDPAVCDQGFDGDAQRRACVDRDIAPQIPNKANRVNVWPFDKEAYRGRNRVERLFGKAKQFRRFATRYEKLRTMYLGVG